MRGQQINNNIERKEKISLDDLYDRYYNELVLWADTILNDMGLAEDLVQDLFVALWEKGIDSRLDAKGARAYLYTSVRNKALRALRGEQKIIDLPDISEITDIWEEADLTHEHLVELVIQELEKLPPRSREVLECIHLKNMKYAEVAEALGISLATVKTLLVRSLKTIRKSVSDSAYLFYVLCIKYLSEKKVGLKDRPGGC